MAPTMTSPLLPSGVAQHGCFIDNEYHGGGGAPWTLHNPKDGTALQELAGASAADVDAAVTAAGRAFSTGPWADAPAAQRARLLHRLADLIDEHAEELARLESLPSGRPISMVLHGDLPRVADVFRYYAGWADKVKGDSYAPEGGFYKIVEHVPLGVCALVTAWNASLHFLAWKAAPALALGNTVVVKPSEKSPLGTLAFGHLARAAGFPPGVFNIVAGDGTAGAALAAHAGVHKISFTGSLATGRRVQLAAAASNLKRVTLELGGKSPAIVFADADLDNAVAWTLRGITTNSGQVCAATSRLIVHEAIADVFVARLRAAFDAIAASLGADPQSPSTTYGPLIDAAQYEAVLGHISAANAKGAAAVTGEKGCYVAPVLVVDPDRESSVYRDEVFGPVLCVETFAAENEALEKANDTHYGLSGAIYTKDISRAIRIWRQVQAGTVCVNCALMAGPQMPNGGFKSSGTGRELGEYALRHYAEPRAVWIKWVLSFVVPSVAYEQRLTILAQHEHDLV
ncbi:putative aldehyde dehydrogenase protein [Neofusicoccum parvum UCRNP2]|uniref:aldehyde dehydrogenase (NAD(+)) n=1 Tax=Botryosphaeria parva (strain UCR-NP2) TaxID=1287680 RepID=R1G4L3_BOTPV|nr:putative aldehyde dehydrogenase protein [Neofusicoccum parvum UCRNP2]